MEFKFNDRVTIIESGFFEGAVGNVIIGDIYEGTQLYEVLLDHGVKVTVNGVNLEKKIRTSVQGR